jgi:putative ABC transport system permease protein
MKALQLMIRNICRQPRRAVLLMFTLTVATFIFMVLVSVPASIDSILNETARTLRLYSYNSDGRYLGVPARYCGVIERTPGVLACMPMVFLRSTYQNEQDTIQAFAIDANKVSAMYPDYGISPDVLGQFEHNRIAAIAGKLLIRAHHWKIGDTITFRADSNRLKIQFVLVGEIPSNNYPNFFMFHRDYLIEAEKAIGISEEKHPPGFLVTRVASAKDMPVVIRSIDQTFHNSEYETATMTESEAVSGLMSTIGDIRTIVYSIFAVIIVTIVLITANSMAIVARDRTTDLAVLRMLGFGRLYVAFIFLGECALLGIAGGAAGSLITLWQFGGGTTLGGVLESAGYLTITNQSAVEAFLAAVMVSVAGALLPALSALRAPPADVLRKAL